MKNKGITLNTGEGRKLVLLNSQARDAQFYTTVKRVRTAIEQASRQDEAELHITRRPNLENYYAVSDQTDVRVRFTRSGNLFLGCHHLNRTNTQVVINWSGAKLGE